MWGIMKKYTTPLYTLTDHLMYRISLKNNTGDTLMLGEKRELKITWKIILSFILSGLALNDRSVQVKDNTNRPLGPGKLKDDDNRLIAVTA